MDLKRLKVHETGISLELEYSESKKQDLEKQDLEKQDLEKQDLEK
jgi:hypothetical protein